MQNAKRLQPLVAPLLVTVMSNQLLHFVFKNKTQFAFCVASARRSKFNKRCKTAQFSCAIQATKLHCEVGPKRVSALLRRLAGVNPMDREVVSNLNETIFHPRLKDEGALSSLDERWSKLLDQGWLLDHGQAVWVSWTEIQAVKFVVHNHSSCSHDLALHGQFCHKENSEQTSTMVLLRFSRPDFPFLGLDLAGFRAHAVSCDDCFPPFLVWTTKPSCESCFISDSRLTFVSLCSSREFSARAESDTLMHNLICNSSTSRKATCGSFKVVPWHAKCSLTPCCMRTTTWRNSSCIFHPWMKNETILCLWMKDATMFHPKANHSGNTFRCMTTLFGACVPKTIFLVLRTFRNIQSSKTKMGSVLLGTMQLKSQPCKSGMHRQPTTMKNSVWTMAEPPSFVDSGHVQV
jgi:hypothetical protein